MPLRPTLEADLDKVAELVAGLIDSYRMVKQFIHADGHRIWGDLAVGCLRRDDRSIEVTIGQIVEITAWHPASATVFPTGTPLGASDVTRFSSLLPGMPSMDQVTRVAEKIIATPPNRSALAARPSWSPSASGPYSQRGTGRIEGAPQPWPATGTEGPRCLRLGWLARFHRPLGPRNSAYRNRRSSVQIRPKCGTVGPFLTSIECISA